MNQIAPNTLKGTALPEPELVRFAWFDDLFKAKAITLDELCAMFGHKLNNGLVKPLSREAVQQRRRSIIERGCRPSKTTS